MTSLKLLKNMKTHKHENKEKRSIKKFLFKWINTCNSKKACQNWKLHYIDIIASIYHHNTLQNCIRNKSKYIYMLFFLRKKKPLILFSITLLNLSSSLGSKDFILNISHFLRFKLRQIPFVKRTGSVISPDLHMQTRHAPFTIVPLKALSNQVWIIYHSFIKSLFFGIH